jgi:hypothetical protein
VIILVNAANADVMLLRQLEAAKGLCVPADRVID